MGFISDFVKFWGKKWKMLGKIYNPFLQKTYFAWIKVGKIYKSQKSQIRKFIIRLKILQACTERVKYGAELLFCQALIGRSIKNKGIFKISPSRL